MAGHLLLGCLAILISVALVKSERRCDVVFCVDTSDSMTLSRTNAAKNAMVKWADYWNIEPVNGVNMALVLFSGNARSEFSLTDKYTKSQAVNAILNYNKASVSGATNLHLCLQLSNEGTSFFADPNRRNARKSLVIITDGNSKDQAATKIQVQNLQANNVKVVAVAIASSSNYDNVTELSIADKFYHVDPFSKLPDRNDIRDVICPACSSSGWQVIDQCDAHSRCIVDSSGTSTTVTEGCGCNRFRHNTNALCVGAGNCNKDPCTDGISGWPFHRHLQSSCRMYWECNRQSARTMSKTMCCLPWEYFDRNSGKCMLSVTQDLVCKEICTCNKPPRIPACRKFADANNERNYFLATQDRNTRVWSLIPQQCNNQNHVFYKSRCGCARIGSPGTGIPDPGQGGSSGGNSSDSSSGSSSSSGTGTNSDSDSGTGASSSSSSSSTSGGTGGSSTSGSSNGSSNSGTGSDSGSGSSSGSGTGSDSSSGVGQGAAGTSSSSTSTSGSSSSSGGDSSD